MTGVKIYDPSNSITYRHPGLTQRASVMARLAHKRAVDSVSLNGRTMVRTGRDPLTGARVVYIDPASIDAQGLA